MLTPDSDPPATPASPHNWRSLPMVLGIFCVVGGVANALMAGGRPSSGNQRVARRATPPDTSVVEVTHE